MIASSIAVEAQKGKQVFKFVKKKDDPMDEIKFVYLDEVQEEQIIELMNNELVRRNLPLLTGYFSLEDCRKFLKEKKQLWNEYGYGPWAILIENEFAGWGGLQPEEDEADFALILYPRFWGWGRRIFDKVKDQAFNQMNFTSITILFPPDRKNSRAVTRFGFIEDGQLTIDGEGFRRFRLFKP